MNTATAAANMNVDIDNDPEEAPLPPPAPPAVPNLNVALTYVGFDTAAIHARLRAEGLTHFSNFKSMKEKYIHDIAESFAKRTASDGRATPNWACQSGARLSTR